MIIYYIKRIFNIVFIPSKIKKNCKNYLNNGTYYFSKNYTVISKDKNKITRTFSDTNKQNKLKSILANLFSHRKLKINTNCQSFNGDTIIISSNNTQCKVIDYDNKLVLTKYFSKKAFENNINNYNYCKDKFNLPIINEINYKSLYTIEEFVNNLDYNNEQCLNYLFDLYLKNNFKKINNYSFKSKFHVIDNIDYHTFDKFTFIKCHGDLWNSNILFSNDKYYIIDYENVNFYSFFYDIFYFIFSEYYILYNISLLRNYFDGKYDSKFKCLFEKYNLKFEKKDRHKYFLLFLEEYINTRWIKLNKFELKKEKIKMEKFLLKIKEFDFNE